MRDCGECIACCSYLRIPALEKEGFEHCKHLDLLEPVQKDVLQLSAGCDSCKIYNDRPEVCKAYSCLWLSGYGEESDRPDKSKMLIDTLHRIDNAIECKPLSEDAADSARGRRAVRRMSRQAQKVALVTTFHETKLHRVVGKPE